MESINTVCLSGHLGADPELKHLDTGPILKLRLATNHVWFDKEQKKQEKTSWHRVTVFGKRAEALAKFLTKGMMVFVQGRLETSSYEKNGEKRTSTDIIAEELSFHGGARSHANGAASRPPAAVVASDLPF